MMTTVADKLLKWSVQELSLVTEGGLNKVPNVESFRSLTKGKNRKIWTYVINHVRSQATVEKIRRTLYLKKLLKEKEDGILPFSDNSTDVTNLQSSVSRAEEKRMYLIRSLSTIEERILSEEQNVKKINDEIFHVNQKVALIELLKRRYDAKNVSSKCLLDSIVLIAKALRVHEPDKFYSEEALPLSYSLFNNDSLISSKFNFRFNAVISTVYALIEMRLTNKSECNNVLMENFRNDFQELKEKNIPLIDVIIFLKKMVDDDIQRAISLNLENTPLNQSFKKQEDEVKVSLRTLKYENVFYSLKTVNNKNKHNQMLNATQEIFKNITESLKEHSPDYEIKCTLLEKLAENEALFASNAYLEENMNTISNKTDILLRKLYNERIFCEQLKSSTEKFYQSADILHYLLGTASDTFDRVSSDLERVRSFVQNELFQPQSFSSTECVKELKINYLNDRKLMWDFCEKTNLVQPLFTEPFSINYPLPVQIRKSLNLHPFQSIHILSETWAHFKQKLQEEAFDHAQVFKLNKNIQVSDMYAKFIKLLERMKLSVEKGMFFANDGMVCCSKAKYFIEEWWDQSAQFIPSIEYEGKTLKMWIDILTVLSDFEPVKYVT